MKPKELIALLEKCNPDLDILAFDGADPADFCHVTELKEVNDRYTPLKFIVILADGSHEVLL